MDEPTWLGAVVIDADGTKWVRADWGHEPWWPITDDDYSKWTGWKDIPSPRLETAQERAARNAPGIVSPELIDELDALEIAARAAAYEYHLRTCSCDDTWESSEPRYRELWREQLAPGIKALTTAGLLRDDVDLKVRALIDGGDVKCPPTSEYSQLSNFDLERGIAANSIGIAEGLLLICALTAELEHRAERDSLATAQHTLREIRDEVRRTGRGPSGRLRGASSDAVIIDEPADMTERGFVCRVDESCGLNPEDGMRDHA